MNESTSSAFFDLMELKQNLSSAKTLNLKSLKLTEDDESLQPCSRGKNKFADLEGRAVNRVLK